MLLFERARTYEREFFWFSERVKIAELEKL